MSDAIADPRQVLTNFTGGDVGLNPHLNPDWLATNGFGGYASGSILGPITRRYHGLLIAALPNPLGALDGRSELKLFQGRHALAGVSRGCTMPW
jgi:hypothetical protein